MYILLAIIALLIVGNGTLLIWTAIKDKNEKLWFRLMELIFGIICFFITVPICAFLR